MSVLVATLDADVLVPIIACDFLLTAFDHRIYEPVVSTTTLEEVERALIEDFPHLASAAIHQRMTSMRAALDDHVIDGVERIDDAPGVNSKDRHVVGAALAARATVIVTNDRQLRIEIDASGLSQRSLDLDTFAIELWESSSTEVTSVIDAMVAKRVRRPVSKPEMLASISLHMPRFATKLAVS